MSYILYKYKIYRVILMLEHKIVFYIIVLFNYYILMIAPE